MKRMTLGILLLALMLAACVQEAGQQYDGYQIYCAAPLSEAAGEDAIEAHSVAIEGSETMSTEALARALLEELLADEHSPIPNGTEVRSLSIAGRRAQIDLSEQYARLSGIDLSLADYCIALTLTQLEGINAVSVTANGRTIPYRATQLLLAADTLLGSREDALRPITVSLYFLDTATGELRAQQQTIALHEGQQRVSALLDALLQGPENDPSLVPLLPEGFTFISGRIDDGICTLSLPGDVALPGEPAEQTLVLESLAQSLLSLSGVETVQIRVGSEVVLER